MIIMAHEGSPGISGSQDPNPGGGEPKPGLKFLDKYTSSETVKVYRNVVRIYLSAVLGRGEIACRVRENGRHEVLRPELESEAVAYFSAGRDYKKDVELFLAGIKGHSPMTVRQRIAIARVYLEENGIELPRPFWRSISRRMRGTRALTIDRVPSNAELKLILQYVPLQGKALFLTLASSGMRIGETLKLKVSDLDLQQSPALAMVRGDYTKSGNSRRAYISGEAREAVEAWLKVRERYMNAAVRRHYGKPRGNDARVFPFSMNVAYEMWYNSMKKAGLYKEDPSTGHSTLHPHVLRKFFRTRMAVIIPVDVVEALMGHEGYLTEAYRRYSQEDLAEFYKKGEHILAVFSNAQDLAKVRKELEESNRALTNVMEGMVLEVQEMKQQMDRIGRRVAFRLGEAPKKSRGRRG
jgi:integrase